MSSKISNSRANTFRRCPKQFEYKYVRKLRKRKIAIQLKRGDWIHRLLMVHADGHDWREEHRRLTAEFNKLLAEEREEYGDLPRECARIMRSYLHFYKDEDKQYRTVDTELDELVELPNGEMFNLIIDKVIEERDGGLWVVDYKTVKTFMDDDYMLIDSQLARYIWGAHKLGFKPLRGAMFDELCTKPPTPPALLKSGKLTKRKNMWCDHFTYVATVKHHKLDLADYADIISRLRSQHDRFFRRTRLPRDRPMVQQLMKELLMTGGDIQRAIRRDEFPRTNRKECRFDCDYLMLCGLELHGADIDDAIRLQYEVSDKSERPPAWVKEAA